MKGETTISTKIGMIKWNILKDIFSINKCLYLEVNPPRFFDLKNEMTKLAYKPIGHILGIDFS